MTFTVVGRRDKKKTAFGGGKNPEDNFAYFPITTFHRLHPEVLDYWITLKYDDQKNKPLVQDEVTRAAAAAAQGANDGARQLRDLRHGLADAALEPDYGRRCFCCCSGCRAWR